MLGEGGRRINGRANHVIPCQPINSAIFPRPTNFVLLIPDDQHRVKTIHSLGIKYTSNGKYFLTGDIIYQGSTNILHFIVKFKTPLEIAKQLIRQQQRITELMNTLKVDLTDPLKHEAALKRTKAAQEKMKKLVDDSKTIRYIILQRLTHLDGALEATSTDQPAYQEWMRCLRDRMTADFLQREGYEKQAEAVIKDSGIQYLVDTELIKQSMQMSDALSNGNCQPALQWCFEHRAVLKRADDNLEFKLRQQEFVELCRNEMFYDALAYAKKHFTPFLDQHTAQIKQALMLLAVPSTTEIDCYHSLYDVEVYQTLSQHFKHTFNAVYILPEFPPLVAILQAGLSALKTSACSNPADHHPECPVCNPPLSVMANSLPAAHFESTHLVCRITGELMNDDNLPMVMPNGYAYSFNVSNYHFTHIPSCYLFRP